LLALASSACGGDPVVSSCPPVSSACPSPAPTYAEVAPIVAAKCAPCHSPTGVEPNRPYQTYDQLKKAQIDILTQVRACRMPKPGSEPLTDAERTTLLGWLYCDAPND
jgi:hypothetical protein